MRVTRVDPKNCGCTDCLLGISIPVNEIPMFEMDGILNDLNSGRIQDATGFSEKDWDNYTHVC